MNLMRKSSFETLFLILEKIRIDWISLVPPNQWTNDAQAQISILAGFSGSPIFLLHLIYTLLAVDFRRK